MNWKNVLFWFFLVISMILLVWNIFGNSPTDFIALAAIMLTILLKIWGVSDRQIKLDMKFNNLGNSFKRLTDDFKQHIKHK